MKKNILFVDDEPDLLELFTLMFEDVASEWKVHTADSAAQALALLDQHQFHAVVTDMRMPRMNGADLLVQVMHRFPQCARFILSGYADQEQVARCVGAAHQFLMKPEDIQNLKVTLERVCALDVFLRNDALKALISKLAVVPSLPSLYFRIVKELRGNDVSIDKLAEIVSSDPGMTSKLLQLVNSAFFGVACKISNPAEAIQYLGVARVRSLALSVHAFACFEPKRLGRFPIEQLWEHSFRTGALAEKLFRSVRKSHAEADEAFIGGLLHDIGKVMLIYNLPDQYEEMLKVAEEKGITASAAEQVVFGSTHAEVGAYLLGLWGLPVSIVEAVAWHHTPAKKLGGQFSTVAAIHIANELQHELSGRAPAFDIPFLQRQQWENRLPEWRSIAADIAQQEAAAAAGV